MALGLLQSFCEWLFFCFIALMRKMNVKAKTKGLTALSDAFAKTKALTALSDAFAVRQDTDGLLCGEMLERWMKVGRMTSLWMAVLLAVLLVDLLSFL